MVIDLPPDIEAAITAEAKSRGVSVVAIIREALAVYASYSPDAAQPRDRDAELEEVLDTLPRLPVLSDRSLTREGIYADNDR